MVTLPAAALSSPTFPSILATISEACGRTAPVSAQAKTDTHVCIGQTPGKGWHWDSGPKLALVTWIEFTQDIKVSESIISLPRIARGLRKNVYFEKIQLWISFKKSGSQVIICQSQYENDHFRRVSIRKNWEDRQWNFEMYTASEKESIATVFINQIRIVARII